MTTKIDLINKGREKKGGFTDNLGHLPISRYHCKMIKNIEDFDIDDVIITHESENKFAQENNINVVDSDGEELDREHRLTISGIIYVTSNQYRGCYYHSDIQAWAPTYKGEDRELVEQLHTAYIQGYTEGAVCVEAPDDVLKSNPRPTVHELDDV